MRSKKLKAFAAATTGLVMVAPANSEQQQKTVTQVSPQIQERLRAQPPELSVQSTLQSTLDKRRFIAKELDKPERIIGLTQPINMYPSAGELIAPGKAHITVGGRVDIDPSARRFRVMTNGSMYLRIVPHVRGRSTPYLVTAVVKLSRETRMSTRATTGARLVGGMERLRPGEHSLNFVVQQFNSDTFLQLFADAPWELERIEITPVLGV